MHRVTMLATCLFFTSILACAQLVFPIEGTYKGMSAQGMAIWGDNSYLFSHGGRCRVLNLQTVIF